MPPAAKRGTRVRPAAAAAVLVVAVLGVVAPAVPAGAHAGGRVQLHVAHLEIHPSESPDRWAVEVKLVDADSGIPAPGYRLTTSGRTPAGADFGPLTLDDEGQRGLYVGSVTGPVGQWTVTVDAQERPGSERAIPLTRTWNLSVEPGGGRIVPGGGGSIGGHSGAKGRTLLLAAVAAGTGGLAVVARHRRRLSLAR